MKDFIGYLTLVVGMVVIFGIAWFITNIIYIGG